MRKSGIIINKGVLAPRILCSSIGMCWPPQTRTWSHIIKIQTLPWGARGTMVLSAQTHSPQRITQVPFGKTQLSHKSPPGRFLCPTREIHINRGQEWGVPMLHHPSQPGKAAISSAMDEPTLVIKHPHACMQRVLAAESSSKTRKVNKELNNLLATCIHLLHLPSCLGERWERIRELHIFSPGLSMPNVWLLRGTIKESF